MAFDPAPTTTLASYASDGTTISVDIADVANLTSGEADATTGDIRQILYRLLEQINATWDALADADKPTKFTIAVATSVPNNVLMREFTVDALVEGIFDVNSE